MAVDKKSNPRYSDSVSLSQLSNLDAGDVSSLGILFPASELEVLYVRDNNNWRMPQYRNAFALGEKLNGILRDVLNSDGIKIVTPVDRDYGFNGNGIRFRFYSGGKTPALEIECGKEIPGYGRSDSYIRIYGKPQIYHINGNPVARLGARNNLPPLVDPRVIPRAVTGSARLARIEFEPGWLGPFRGIMRKEKVLDASNPDMKRLIDTGVRIHEWFAFSEKSETRLDEKSAAEFAGFIENLAFNRIPRLEEIDGKAAGLSGKKLRLGYESEDRSGALTSTEYILEILSSDGKGNRHIFFSGTGLVSSITERDAERLLPDFETLLRPPAPPPVPKNQLLPNM